MIIKNNSKHEWLNYNCGGDYIVDVTAGCILDVPDGVGEVLLRNLGHPNWLVKVDNPTKEEKEKSQTYAEHTKEKFSKEHPEEVKRQADGVEEEKVAKAGKASGKKSQLDKYIK